MRLFQRCSIIVLMGFISISTFADVAITAVDEGNQNIAIYVDSATVIRGVALKLTISGGNIASSSEYLASDFNTFVDYAFTNAGYVVGAGHPFADPLQAGVLAVYPATEFSINVGYLDQGGAKVGLTGKKLIARIHISNIVLSGGCGHPGGTATIAFEEDTLRGGIVGDNIGAKTIASPGVIGTITSTECLNQSATFYKDWVAWGCPDCWCYRKQCQGDADGNSQFGRPVMIGDLTILKKAFNRTDAQLLLVPNGICADFNHRAEFGKRVLQKDLTIFKTYFNKTDVPVCDNANYNFWTN